MPRIVDDIARVRFIKIVNDELFKRAKYDVGLKKLIFPAVGPGANNLLMLNVIPPKYRVVSVHCNTYIL
ncbi:hypothetical protein EV662_12510 [Rhodovulum marinum]|uniref:Uncharacterized protein n=1 Tax=Rhodovulum marinum TaxID=320662 RepID=A0A4R2PQE8_9RHOB|nr:hypothetical protein EV662_12510 [Rhodovulum marinum]